MVKRGVRKEIKRWGNSCVIVLTREDLKLYNLEVGDVLDISNFVVIKKNKKGSRKSG